MHTLTVIGACVGGLYAAVALYAAWLVACKRIAARAERREFARLTATTKTTAGGNRRA